MGSVFVSPLNWGLGHASRDVPVIRELILRGHEVTIGTSGNALAFLKKECPECNFIQFEDYPIPNNNGMIFLPTYTAYIPILIKAYLSERKKAEKIFSKNNFDLIISDSRSVFFQRKCLRSRLLISFIRVFLSLHGPLNCLVYTFRLMHSLNLPES